MGGSWHLASNWADGILPGPGDDVVIPALSNNTVTYSTGATSIRSLTTSMGFDFTGGTLRADRMIALNNGSVNIKGNLQNTDNSLAFDGSGTFTVSGSINGGTVNLLSGVTLHSAGSGGTLNGVIVNGGVLTDNGWKLNGVTLNGDIALSAPVFAVVSLSVTNGLTLNGTARLVSSSFAHAQIRFSGSQTLAGTGTVTFLSNTFCNLSEIKVVDRDSTLTIGPHITVGGSCGDIGPDRSDMPNRIDNQGTISADGPGNFFGITMWVDGTNWSNEGTIQARNGGTLVAQGTNWTNTGTVQVQSGGVLTAQGTNWTNLGTFQAQSGGTLVAQGTPTNFTAGTLRDGTWQVFADSTLRLISSGIVTNAANMVLDGPNSNIYRDMGSTSALVNFTTNAVAGSLTVRNGRNFATTAAFTNDGTLTVGARSVFRTSSLTNFADNTLTGGTYVLSGTLQFDNADIRTNAATIVLEGPLGEIVDQAFADGLADWAVNAIEGTFVLRSGRSFTVASAFTNDGTLSIAAGSTFQTPYLTNFADTTLTGGTYVVQGTLQFNDADIQTNASTLVLDGTAARIVNQADADALAHFATNDAVGSFTIRNGRNFTAASTFTNRGNLTIAAGCTFRTLTLTSFSSTTLTEGTYVVGGTLQFNNADIRTNAASLVLDGPSARIVNQADADALAHFTTNTVGGSFLIQIGRNFTTPGAFSNAGNVVVGAGTVFTTSRAYNQMSGGRTILNGGTLAATNTVVIQPGSTLSGSGIIQASVVNAGQIDVGGPGTAGRLAIPGDFTQLDTGVLSMELGGLVPGSSYDQLDIGGTALLGGTLNIALLDDFFVHEVDSFQVLKYGARSGDFAQINGLDLSETLSLNPSYNDNSLTLIAAARP
jgi:autotransporter-associated beta strand protein